MSNARFSMRGPSLVATLFGRIDANNAEDVEQGIRDALAAHVEEGLVLDLDEDLVEEPVALGEVALLAARVLRLEAAPDAVETADDVRHERCRLEAKRDEVGEGNRDAAGVSHR